MIKEIDLTQFNRVLIFGDLHGELDLLFEAYTILKMKPSCAVVSCGDVIDRGPRSFDTAMHFISGANKFAVLGNHEDMFVKSWLHQDRAHAINHYCNGGDWSDRYDTAMLEYLAQLIEKNFPVVLKANFHGIKLAFAHADLPSVVDNKSVTHSLKTILWNHKSHENSKEISNFNLAIHGHKILPEPTIANNRLYIDTGCGIETDELSPKYGLTCLEILKDKAYLHRFYKLYNGRIHYDVLSDNDPTILALNKCLFD